MDKLEHGSPTGRLNEKGTMMEINMLLIEADGQKINAGKRWIPVTQEMKEKILSGRPHAISTGPVNMSDWITAAGILAKGSKPEVFPAENTGESTNLSLEGSSHNIEFVPALGDLELPAKTPDIWPGATRGAHHLVPGAGLLSSGNSSAPKPENSGGNVNYYSVRIDSPKRPERQPYTFEVEDLIEALNLSFHEGTVLKSLIRSAVERELGLAKQGNDAIRDAEKMAHSSKEHLRILKLRKDRK